MSEGALGRALVMKAHALYYEYLRTMPSGVYDVRTREKYRPKPEAWELVQRGRSLLQEHEPASLEIADAVVNILREYSKP